MITVSVPEQAVADALGPVGDDARVIVWDPAESDPPEDERDRITIACLAHYTGGRTVYGRLGMCGELEVIQIPSAGFEHALPFVPAGVSLANARGVHDSRVAEMTLALALASRRGLPQFLDAQRREKWEPVFDTRSVADSRALVVGYGSIGAAIGVRLRASEVHVEGVARTARTAPDGTTIHAVEDLPTLLPAFDIVVIVTPHSEATDKLVDAEFLAAMPDGALLINVGRGKVVDTDALLAELQSRRLHAALDVTEPEPLPTGHPLWSAPQCIVVPHVAGVEVLTNRRFTDVVKRQIEARRRGDDPVNFVAMGAFPA
ncbi:NAD(P)-dependent oxidoreductase [Demequina sp.]|uniref:NAD(P)-dependent oxidoreductase n=1 Tax=Demequina sp. TaxID=2050685 RepID=UPI0025BFD6F0|nr:NAD(P)-dependent oxidoreductase [Demequina sp.]